MIWMNVTTSANWKRPPVGIVRVERALCLELAKLYGQHFKQCTWQGGKFVETVTKFDNDAPLLVEHSTLQSMGARLPPMFPILPKKQALIAVGQGLLSLMPKWLQGHFNRLLYALRSRISRLRISDRVKHLRAKVSKSAKAIKFSVLPSKPKTSQSNDLFAPGDVLLSIGLDWDYPYYKQFYELRKTNGVKIVTCCYDLIPVRYPQYCVNDVAGLFTSYFLEIADASDLILCISKQSEADLREMLESTGGARPATHVFPLGDSVPEGHDKEIASAVKAICRQPFILYVSTIERRKNHEVLYRAYHLLCSQGKRSELPKLVFVGMQGWGVGELLKDIELDPLTRDLIIRLNHVSDAELRVLYQAARFCVFPSLYEGWGLPVGEALSMGKAVICSNRGSLPEVGGDMVLYADPWNPLIWAQEIFRMSTDDEWRSEWERNIRDNYSPRTWHRAALSVKNGIDQLDRS